MNKNILTEVSRIKKMMGLVNEQAFPNFPKDKIPSECPDNEDCFFYVDGNVYMRNGKSGLVKNANGSLLTTHLEDLGVLGLRKTDKFGPKPENKTGNGTADILIPVLVKYAITGNETGDTRKFFPNYTQEDAFSSLIIPWRPNAKKAIYGLPLYSYDDTTVYLDPNDKLVTPKGNVQVTEPSVSNDD